MPCSHLSFSPDHTLCVVKYSHSNRMQSVQNLGLAVVPIIAGIVVDSGGYMLTEVMFCALLCLALLCGIALYVYDATHGGKLNKSAWARAREAKKKDEMSKSG